jgi:DNA (cytosine-5)-methyltransferase 1
VNVGSLFSGIGGLDLGLERAGINVVGQVEIDPWCRRVLARHWPDVPQHDDVHTAADWWLNGERPHVDLVFGGFPCQPVSDAGLKMAQQDERWLWPQMHDLIDTIRPTWVVGENVPGLRTRGLNLVLRDLRRLGYVVRAGYISACEVGAPHARQRLFVLAHAASVGRCPWRTDGGRAGTADGRQAHAETPRGTWWSREPDVDRVAYGVPSGVDRRRGLGNAVVPQVAEHIGRILMGHAARVEAAA